MFLVLCNQQSLFNVTTNTNIVRNMFFFDTNADAVNFFLLVHTTLVIKKTYMLMLKNSLVADC